MWYRETRAGTRAPTTVVAPPASILPLTPALYYTVLQTSTRRNHGSITLEEYAATPWPSSTRSPRPP